MKSEYINYFNEKISMIKNIIKIDVPIYPADHEQIKGHEKALGICYGYKNDNGKMDVEKITIDDYFIEENYEAEINGKWWMLHFVGQNLVDVVCHEIAHIYEWRHGKKHKEITQCLIELVNTRMSRNQIQRGAA